MKKYLSFFKMRLLAGLQYRTAALAGMATQLVWGAMEILLYRAFYLENPAAFPMGMEALASYIWLQQAFLAFFALWQWEMELIEAVRTGAVAYELTRPMGLYGMWMARSLGLRLSRGLLRCWPIVLVGALLPAPYGLRLHAENLGLFALSAVLMLVLACAYVLIVYAASFYMSNSNGFQVLSVAAADLLGGAIVPIPFLPEPLRTVAAISPFGSMQNVPLRIFGGDLTGTAALEAVGLQLFWCVALIGLGGAMVRGGVRRTVIAGG